MIQVMESQKELVAQFRKEKQKATRLKRKTEEMIKEASTASRRASSRLRSANRRIGSQQEEMDELSAVLDQKNAQLESVKRLISAAGERLQNEREAAEQIRQDIEFAETPEIKQTAVEKLRSLESHMNDLTLEIQTREKTSKAIADDVAARSKMISRISAKIQKKDQSKTMLLETVQSSQSKIADLEKELETLKSSEASAQTGFDRESAKLKELEAEQKAEEAKPTQEKAETSSKTAAKRASEKTAGKKAGTRSKRSGASSKRPSTSGQNHSTDT